MKFSALAFLGISFLGSVKGNDSNIKSTQIGTLGHDKSFSVVADVSNFRRRIAYTVGHNSCIKTSACYLAGASNGHFIAGDNSCIGLRACSYGGYSNTAGVIVGNNSCNGDVSCYGVGYRKNGEIVIGIGSCNCKDCCRCFYDVDVVEIVVRDGTCNSLGNGLEHCCSSESTRSTNFDFLNTGGAPVNGVVPSSTPSKSAVPSSTPSMSAVPSSTPSKSAVPSSTPSKSAVPSSTPSKSAVPSSTPSKSAVPSSTPSMSAVPSSTPSKSAVPSTIPTKSSLPSGNPSKAPDYGVTSSDAVKGGSNMMNVTTTFGHSSSSFVMKLMEPTCTTEYSGDLLDMQTGDSWEELLKDVNAVITVDPKYLNTGITDGVVTGDYISGNITFCIKSHSTHKTTNNVSILMEVIKKKYAIEYSGEDTKFEMSNDIKEEDITEGTTFEDGQLVASSYVLVRRCSETSTDVTTGAITEEDILYLCIAPSNDNSNPNIALELKDINLRADYGVPTSPIQLNLVTGSNAQFTFVNVDKSDDGIWTRIAIPILSDFIEKATDTGDINLKLKGDADVAFVQNDRRLDTRRLDNVTVPFEFDVQLLARNEVGCVGQLYNMMSGFFL